MIAVTSPAEGGFFDFGDQIPFDVTVTDAEDGTISGTHADCSRVEIDYLLGHDEHAHPLTDATGCQGTIQTAGEAGHGADANIFGVLAAAYTDKGGAPGAGPLRSEKEIVIWPKLLQAEHYTEMRGIQTVAQANAGGGERVGYTDNAGGTEAVNYIAWDPVDLRNISSLTVTASSGGGGGPIEVRIDDPATGPLLGTVNVPNTGAWENQQDFNLPITPPAGKHKLFFAFPNGGLDVDQIRFNGRGISSNARPTASAAATPGGGRRAAPGPVHRHRDRPRGRRADLRLGLRRRLRARDHAERHAHLHPARHLHRALHGARRRRPRGHRHGDHPGHRLPRRARPRTTSSTAPSSTSAAGRRSCATTRPAARSRAARWRSTPATTPTCTAATRTPQNVVLQPAPDGGWEATTKVDIALAEKTYEQAALMVYGSDQDFAKLSFIKVPEGRNLEFILQQDGQPRRRRRGRPHAAAGRQLPEHGLAADQERRDVPDRVVLVERDRLHPVRPRAAAVRDPGPEGRRRRLQRRRRR